jgi:hypothetical protein
MASQRFTARVEAGQGGGAFVVVPVDARAPWGEARPPVAAVVSGVPYRSRLAVYGGRTMLGLTRKLRSDASIEIGDEVVIELDRDDAPREVDIPAELRAALDAHDVARTTFEALSFTHRREYAAWIAEAKRPQTRRDRAARTIEMLAAGATTPKG